VAGFFMTIWTIIFLTVLTVPQITFSKKISKVSSEERKLTKKESEELNGYSKKEALMIPLITGPNAPNRFDKNTLYVMNNFKIIQKIAGGYLIIPNMDGMNSSLEFDLAYLQTSKDLPQNAIISGAVIYIGQYKYKALNGFSQSVAKLKIPANLPIAAKFLDNPFKEEFF
jgi:hypothetical protein